MDESRINDKDRLSKMPEHIIHDILSFLPIEDTARISILSKTLGQVRASLPIFCFDYFRFSEGLKSVLLPVEEEEKFMIKSANQHFETKKKREQYMEELRNTEHFLKHLDQSLERVCKLQLRIRKFILLMNTHGLDISDMCSRIDRWIGLASKRYVEELDLQIPVGGEYSLPPAIVSAKSLTILTLVNCRFDQPFLRDSRLKFSSLQKLDLKYVHVDDQILENLIGGCPLIEVLSIEHCLGLKHIRISGVNELKKITLLEQNEVESVDIVALSLQTLWYAGYASKVNTIHVDGCGQSLIKLHLTGFAITEQLFKVFLSSFPLLEALNLSVCNMLKRIKISSSRLKELVLKECMNLVDAEIYTPNLHVLKLDNCLQLVIAQIDAPDHIEFDMEIENVNWPNTYWFLRLKSYLAKFKKIDDLHIIVPLASVMIKFFSMGVGEGAEPLIAHNVEHLTLRPDESLCFQAEDVNEENYYSFLLDGLLWSFHPNTIILEAYSYCGCNNVKLLSDTLMNYREKESDVNGWRHYLKDVKKNFEGTVPLDWNTEATHEMDQQDWFEVRFELKW